MKIISLQEHKNEQWIDLIHNINLESLFFIEAQKKVLINNTKYFLEGGQGNNALLWGSRGTGKSTLVYAIYNLFKDKYVFLMIEIKFFQIKHLPKLLRSLEKIKEKIIIYCDDFSFEKTQQNHDKIVMFSNIDFWLDFVTIFARFGISTSICVRVFVVCCGTQLLLVGSR